jgi:putative NADH-flavin reductase
LLTNAVGNSSVSMGGFAVALVDETEQPGHARAHDHTDA